MAGKEITPMQYYMDVNPEIGTIGEDEVRKMFGLYALPPVAADTDFDRMPRSTDTFRRAYEYEAPMVGRIVHRMTQELDCWQFRLMPVRKTDKMTINMQHVHRNITPLDLAPEQAAPKTMDHFTELFTTQLVRQNKGMRLNNDFYKTAIGRQEALDQTRDIGASTVLSLKLSGIQGLMTCKNAYQDRVSQSPSARLSAQEQFISETRNFGLLGTNQLALYIINDEAKKIMATAVPSVKPDTAIFSSGDLSFVAFNSKHETDYYLSGNDSSGKNISKQRLDMAGKSFSIKGLRVYEDEPYQLPSLYSGSFEPLIRNVQIGRSFTVSPHEYLGLAGVDYSRAMSFKYWNAKKDDYTLFPARELVRQSCRWGPEGSLREEHWSLCDEFQDFQPGAGLGPDKRGVLDPFLYRDGGSYTVCEAVGDMEPAVLSDDFVRLFGEEFRAKSAAEVGEDVARSMAHLFELSSSLYNGPTDERVQNFLAAVLLMPDNVPPEPDDGSGRAPPKWIAHTFGSPHLPYRDPGTSFLYTREPSGAAEDWLDAPVVLVRSKQTQAPVGYRVYSAPGPGARVPTGGRADRVLRLWAKADEHGKVTTSPLEDPNYQYERCPSYDKPYGYCDYPTMCYLASLHNSGDTRGWSEATLDAVATGIAAFKTHYDLARRVFPGNLAFSESNVPDYLYTGDPDIDAAAAYFHNDFLRGEHNGVVGREVVRDGGGLVVSLSADYARGDADADHRAEMGQGHALWRAMGGSASAGVDVVSAMIAYIVSRVKPHMQKELGEAPETVFEGYEGGALANLVASFYTGATKKFSWFFEHFIVDWYVAKMRADPDSSETYLDQCVNLFQAVLNTSRSGVSVGKVASVDDLENLVQAYRFSQERRLHPARAESVSGSRKLESALRRLLVERLRGDKESLVARIAAFPGEVPDESTVSSRCMRMSLSPKPYRFLSDQPEKLMGLVAWPCSPVHPLEPITEWPITPGRESAVTAAFAQAGSKRTRHGMGARRMPAPPGKRRAAQREEDHYPYKGRRTATAQRPRRAAPEQRFDPGDAGEQAAWGRAGTRGGGGRQQQDGGAAQGPTPGVISYSRMRQGGDLSSSAVVDEWHARDAWSGEGLPIRNNLVQALLKSMVVSKNPVARLGSQLFVQSRICMQQFLAWLDEKLPVPDSYTYAAPFEELAMGSAVFADSAQAGNTFLGWEDMVLQFEATHKTYIGHFNCYMGSVISDPSKICVIPDVSFKRIVKGFDGSVCTAPEDFRPDRPRREQKKVGFVFSHGPGFKASDMPTPFWTLQGKVDEKKYRLDDESSALRWPGDAYYNHLWGFNRLNQSSVLDNSSLAASVHSTHVNVTMAQGRQMNWDPTTCTYGTNGYVVKGSGHLKNWEAKSVLSVLSGKEMALEA